MPPFFLPLLVKMVSVQDASNFNVDEHNIFFPHFIHSILFVVSLSFVSPLSLVLHVCIFIYSEGLDSKS